MKPTLLIIAAGLGSRYGGLKQIESVGPNGEILIDYSIYDAIRAGFGKLVFVIRHYFEDAFREKIGNKFDRIAETAYAYQELESCLEGFPLPPNREKPWGTGHAILVARDVINEPFAVINADDYYGPNSFKVMRDYLVQSDRRSESTYSMVGYVLRNTLSEYGYVSRGVCELDGQMFLKKVTERTKVEKQGSGARYFDEAGNEEYHLTGNEIVLMNLWGFQPSIFKHLQSQFNGFLREYGQDLNKEFFIPTVVDSLIESGQAQVKVLLTDDSWFGIAYREDKPKAVASINKLVEKGVYPQRLWDG
jgi:UTP-glucose-1-phosphate uridylyltransferase